jgi:hypothetical protein
MFTTQKNIHDRAKLRLFDLAAAPPLPAAILALEHSVLVSIFGHSVLFPVQHLTSETQANNGKWNLISNENKRQRKRERERERERELKFLLKT